MKTKLLSASAYARSLIKASTETSTFSAINVAKFGVLAFTIFALNGCDSSQKAAENEVGTAQEKSAVAEAPAKKDIYEDYINRDVRDDIFYFVLPDRFDNGDPSNDEGSRDNPVSFGGFDPTNKGFFHGGDLQGLKNRLGYLKDMGVTAVWMTPILRNKAIQRDETGYHGYWVVDFTQLDSHLGTNADLKDLIDTAHSMGMKVFFDIITNHTADVIKYRECHDEKGVHLEKGATTCPYKETADLESGKEKPYTVFIPEGEERVKFPAWLNDPKYYHNQGDSFWKGESSMKGDFVGLDDLNTQHPEVVSGMIDIYKNIVTNFRPDGFRVDTVKHVHLSFWQQFVPAIMAHAKAQGIPNFHMFGEVYSGDPAVLSKYTTLGKMPSVLDFGFQSDLGATLTEGYGTWKFQNVIDQDDYYNDHDSQTDLLMNFIGNHDMGRFSLFMSRNMPEATEEQRLKTLNLAHAIMYYSRGIPVVYYGDEQGFVSDDFDMDSRENMMPSKVESYNDNDLLGTDKTTADDNFDQSHPAYLALKHYAKVIKEHRSLRRGVHHARYTTGDKDRGIYAFSRVDLDNPVEYLIVANTSYETKSVSLKATSESYTAVDGETENMTVVDGKINVTVPALSYAVFKADTAIAPVEVGTARLISAQVDPRAPHFIDVQYTLPGAAELAIPHVSVTTEYKDADGKFQLASVDYTLPFSSKLRVDKLPNGLDSEIMVVVSDLNGNTSTTTFKLNDAEKNNEASAEKSEDGLKAEVKPE